MSSSSSKQVVINRGGGSQIVASTEKMVLLRQQNEGQQMNFLFFQPKILLRFVDRTKHFVVVKKYFCYPYSNKNDFVGVTKSFFP